MVSLLVGSLAGCDFNKDDSPSLVGTKWILTKVIEHDGNVPFRGGFKDTTQWIRFRADSLYLVQLAAPKSGAEGYYRAGGYYKVLHGKIYLTTSTTCLSYSSASKPWYAAYCVVFNDSITEFEIVGSQLIMHTGYSDFGPSVVLYHKAAN